ncbi:MAG: DNA-processing protein DprA [Rhodocyclaceae bacterium]|nr:DNA-processing protein DprA [Rhodocyclaceae bacterium]
MNSILAEQELSAWLRLTLTPGVGGESQRALLANFGLPAQIFTAGRAALARVLTGKQADALLADETGEAVAAALAWAAEPGNHVLTLADPGYPQKLLEIPDPPTLLYVKGRCELLNRPALAVVGSRNATAQGLVNAEAFAATLSAGGMTIVSGLALGIDAAAHRGGLKGSGGTIAVVGTGADRTYPAGNRELARAIAERGAIVSDFPLGTPAIAGNFPRRNRLISGLSRGVLVVEAAERSGSLITARLAGEQGRDVFAIPGSIHSPLSKGCHRLIKQGAKLVDDARDILEELTPGSPRASAVMPAAEGDAARMLDALGFDPCDLDTLVQRSGLSPQALSSFLLQLELDGQVAMLPGGRYQRVSAR